MRMIKSKENTNRYSYDKTIRASVMLSAMWYHLYSLKNVKNMGVFHVF